MNCGALQLGIRIIRTTPFNIFKKYLAAGPTNAQKAWDIMGFSCFFCLVLYGSQENPTAQWALSQHFRPVPMVQQPGAGPRRPNKQGVEMS